MSENSKKHTRLQTKFLFGLAAILIMFSALASMTIYYFQVKSLENEAYQKANLIMSSMEASRSYVREVLRPRMYKLVEDEDFIIQAMSSSYVSREIAERIGATNQDMEYRRVAINARNSTYEANDFERKMIDYFRNNQEEDEWHAIVKDEDGHLTFVKLKPVIVNKSCLHCHGDPDIAPGKIIELYGAKQGFYRAEGQISGLVSVAIPVDINIQKIKEIAITVFMAVVPSLIFLYAIISIFFNQVVSQNLRNILTVFRSSMKDEKGLQLLEQSQTLDEIEELKEAAVTIADYLEKNHGSLERYAHELYHSKELLQSVFDGISDPVVLLGRHGELKIVNRAFLESYGLDDTISLNANIYELTTSTICPISRCRGLIEVISEEPVSREVKLESGEIFQLYFYPVTDEMLEEAVNIVCYVKNITEEKKLEEKIQHAEKIVSMGQVAAGVAHEINNPLGVILCHIDFIRDDKNLSEQSRADLAIIEKHVGNCRKIVADLLRFSRPVAESQEVCSVNELISEVLGMVMAQLEKQQIRVKTEFSDDIPALCVDIDRVKQVILNLVLNARHAIDSAGTITVRTLLVEDGKCVQIEVEDDGRGIEAHLQAKVFEPFFTTKEPGEGTGLGLAVSYGIIQNHNGTIQVQSKIGEGTCFIIRIPVQENSDT